MAFAGTQCGKDGKSGMTIPRSWYTWQCRNGFVPDPINNTCIVPDTPPDRRLALIPNETDSDSEQPSNNGNGIIFRIFGYR